MEGGRITGLRTPFWIVTDGTDGVPSPVEPPCAPSHFAAAFTNAAKARRYIDEHESRRCDVALVTSRMLPTVAQTYKLLGVEGFCVNPDASVFEALVRFDDVD